MKNKIKMNLFLRFVFITSCFLIILILDKLLIGNLVKENIYKKNKTINIPCSNSIFKNLDKEHEKTKECYLVKK